MPKVFAEDGFLSLDSATDSLVNRINTFYFYAIKRIMHQTDAINRTIFVERDMLWFEIYNSYAIKHIMQLTGFVCMVFWTVVDILHPQIFVQPYGDAGSNCNLILKKSKFFRR